MEPEAQRCKSSRCKKGDRVETPCKPPLPLSPHPLQLCPSITSKLPRQKNDVQRTTTTTYLPERPTTQTATMSTRIPHLLTPYLNLPPSSLTLLTSVLGATTNWLLLRYLAYHLAPRIADDEESPHGLRRSARGDEEAGGRGKGEGEGDTAVVLVSFMRDYAFWKDGAARLVRSLHRLTTTPSTPQLDTNGTSVTQGLDLDLAARSSTFTFVDGLTSLFLPASPEKLPRGRRVLRSAKLEDVTRELSAAVEELRGSGKRVLLFIDQPDCFLAVGGGKFTSLGLNDAILSLREVRYIHTLPRPLSPHGPFKNHPSDGGIEV